VPISARGGSASGMTSARLSSQTPPINGQLQINLDGIVLGYEKYLRRKDMLNNVKIGTKLVGGFLIVSFISVIIGGFGIYNIRKISKAGAHAYQYEPCLLLY